MASTTNTGYPKSKSTKDQYDSIVEQTSTTSTKNGVRTKDSNPFTKVTEKSKDLMEKSQKHRLEKQGLHSESKGNPKDTHFEL